MLVNPFSQTVADALFSDHINLALAVEIVLDGAITRTHTGTGTIVIEGNAYVGVGELGAIGDVKEQNSTSATQLSLTLAGIDSSSISLFLNENCVGKQASLFIVALDDNFQTIDYDVMFRGKIKDTAVLGGANSAINVNLSNVFEEWALGKSWRYTDESQRKINGGDRIFRYVSQMSDRSIYWGSKKDAPPFRYD